MEHCAFVFGGLAPTTKRANLLEEFWAGKNWTYDNFVASLPIVETQFPLPKDVPGGMPGYRLVLAKSFLYKFFQFASAKVRSVVGEGFVPRGLELFQSDQELSADAESDDMFHKELFHLQEGAAIEGYQHWGQHGASGTSVAVGKPNKHMA